MTSSKCKYCKNSHANNSDGSRCLMKCGYGDNFRLFEDIRPPLSPKVVARAVIKTKYRTVFELETGKVYEYDACVFKLNKKGKLLVKNSHSLKWVDARATSDMLFYETE